MAQSIVVAPKTPQEKNDFNVMDYGAVGDGKIDDSKAFLKAWTDVCGSNGENQVLVVPQGKEFLLSPLTFSGPCKSSHIQISVQGNLVAPNTSDLWTKCEENSWILFKNVQGLGIIGSGKIDGQGSLWWNKPLIVTNGCTQPMALRFHSCNGLQLRGLTHLNSGKQHISIANAKFVELSHLNIIAPRDSPNTDGINIANVTNVFIHDTIIGTGDDCIAIKGESFLVNITRVTCGPGHGISIGSLGNDGDNDVVEQVLVKDCTFNGSTNGARIKTYQGGLGHVSGVTFQGIKLINTTNPINIDQFYCVNRDSCPITKRAVQVSDVTFRGFQGTSANSEAISLRCSASVACTNIELENIKITPFKDGLNLTTNCENVRGTILPPVTPDLSTCLSK
ncbi:probable polygalacturonase At3g15720 [Chenopodium quinoa]|uniref:probable polygalacturonase At3g15720 n=1 Tax=Chenopodium quinoa TaxID=63459 RepID=UPI000B7866EE|nr:probable polygalacturonase At3g15720 [Chenopodium quinoa]